MTRQAALSCPTREHPKAAVDGFHSVPLDSESQPLTTFITEWG